MTAKAGMAVGLAPDVVWAVSFVLLGSSFSLLMPELETEYHRKSSLIQELTSFQNPHPHPRRSRQQR
jgi:hypothetical protein